MFVGKAKNLLQGAASENYFTPALLANIRLSWKCLPGTQKHSSLFRTIVYWSRKKFCNTGTWWAFSCTLLTCLFKFFLVVKNLKQYLQLRRTTSFLTGWSEFSSPSVLIVMSGSKYLSSTLSSSLSSSSSLLFGCYKTFFFLSHWLDRQILFETEKSSWELDI